jgi:hypothetical protein
VRRVAAACSAIPSCRYHDFSFKIMKILTWYQKILISESYDLGSCWYQRV